MVCSCSSVVLPIVFEFFLTNILVFLNIQRPLSSHRMQFGFWYLEHRFIRRSLFISFEFPRSADDFRISESRAFSNSTFEFPRSADDLRNFRKPSLFQFHRPVVCVFEGVKLLPFVRLARSFRNFLGVLTVVLEIFAGIYSNLSLHWLFSGCWHWNALRSNLQCTKNYSTYELHYVVFSLFSKAWRKCPNCMNLKLLS